MAETVRGEAPILSPQEQALAAVKEIKRVPGARALRRELSSLVREWKLADEGRQKEIAKYFREKADKFGEKSRTRDQILAIHDALTEGGKGREPTTPSESAVGGPPLLPQEPPEEPTMPSTPEEEKRPKKRPDLVLDPWMTGPGDLANPEVVQPIEWGPEGLPVYGQFENINQVVFAVRGQLNDAVMRNGWIRPDNDEDLVIRGWIRQAEDLAKEAGGKGTKEWKIYEDLNLEYQAVKECLAWWHDGVLSHVEPAGKAFEQLQNRGTDFAGRRMKWLYTGYRGKEISSSLGKQCLELEINPSEQEQRKLAEKEKEENIILNKCLTPNERLAGILRLGTALGIKDGGVENVVKLELHGKREFWVIANPVSISPLGKDLVDEAEKGTGYLYEMYRIFNLDAYGMKYLLTRHANLIYALEYAGLRLIGSDNRRMIEMDELLRLPENEREPFGWDHNLSDEKNRLLLNDKLTPVFINHLNQQMTGFYTMWQEMGMADFWYSNLDNLNEERKIVLGWDPALGPEENKKRLLCSKWYDFIKSLPIDERQQLDERPQHAWDPNRSDEENWRVMEITKELKKRLDIRKEDYNLLLKKNLISFRPGDITSEEWSKMNWEQFPDYPILNLWGQHLFYMQTTMKDIVDILRGIDVRQKIDHLGSGEEFRHVVDELAYIKERERIHWWDAYSESMLYGFRTYREKGNRHPLATTIKSEIPKGFYRGFLRTFEFLACGIPGIDWVVHPERMMTQGNEHLAIRQLLQRLSEIKIVRDGIIKQYLGRHGIDYKDFVDFAGLEVRKVHYDFFPFGKELNTTEDLDILEDYFVIPEEYRGKLLEPLGRCVQLRREGEELKRRGQLDEARIKFGQANEALQESKDFIKNLSGIIEVRARVKGEKTFVPSTSRKRIESRLLPLNDEELLNWYEKIKNIHFKGELETEVDLKILREYLTLTEEQREGWLRQNAGKAEAICQVWAEFDPMTESERKTWIRENRNKAQAIMSFIRGWPGRSGWNRMEQGELVMAAWSAIDVYLAQFYENNPRLKRKWFGLWYDLWERETRLFRINRRQKASMDFRTDDQRRWILREIEVEKDGERKKEKVKVQAPEDVIVGCYIHDQMDWDEETQNLFIHDDEMIWDEAQLIYRRDELCGIDRLSSMMMGTGEYWPGDPREVSPLYYGHKTDRIIRRFFARQSIGYRLKQAINEARRLGLKLEEYWEAYRPDREVLTPQKMYAIITGLEQQGTIDFNEVPDLLRMYGSTENEWVFFRDERRQARVRDIEDKAEAGVEVEYRQTMDKVASQMAGQASGLLNMILSGQTGRERGRIARNVIVGASIPVTLNMAGVFYGWPIFSTPFLGPLLAVPSAGVAVFLTLDRGDQDRGLRWFTNRILGTLAREREMRRNPYVIQKGYQDPLFLRVVPEGRRNFILLNAFRVPASWDDWVDGAAIIQAVTKSKSELGFESAEK